MFTRSALLGIWLALSCCLFAAPTAAEADPIIGSWSGNGIAQPAEGPSEPVRCRMTYSTVDGRTFELSARCSHTHGIFEQTGRVVKRGGNRYSGRIYSGHYDATGEVSVSLSGGQQTMTVKSDRGSVRITLRKQ